MVTTLPVGAVATGRLLVVEDDDSIRDTVGEALRAEGYEVITFMADVGQEEDFEAAKEKALKIGATKCYIEDLRREFIEEFALEAEVDV